MRRRVKAEMEALILPLSPLTNKLIAYEAEADIHDSNQFLLEMRKLLKGDIVQAVDARPIAEPRHLQAAALHTLLSKGKWRSWIKDINLRFIAFLTGQKQVTKAVEKAGIKVGKKSSIVVCVVTEDPEETLERLEELSSHQNLNHTPRLIDDQSEKRMSWLIHYYEVRKEELRNDKDAYRTLTDILVERMAILSLEI